MRKFLGAHDFVNTCMQDLVLYCKRARNIVFVVVDKSLEGVGESEAFHGVNAAAEYRFLADGAD